MEIEGDDRRSRDRYTKCFAGGYSYLDPSTDRRFHLNLFDPMRDGTRRQLSPFARTLRSGVGTIGPATAPPISYLSSRYANPLGNGMGDWKSSAEGYSQQPAQPATSPQEPGGLLGIIQDYLRNNPEAYRR